MRAAFFKRYNISLVDFLVYHTGSIVLFLLFFSFAFRGAWRYFHQGAMNAMGWLYLSGGILGMIISATYVHCYLSRRKKIRTSNPDDKEDS